MAGRCLYVAPNEAVSLANSFSLASVRTLYPVSCCRCCQRLFALSRHFWRRRRSGSGAWRRRILKFVRGAQTRRCCSLELPSSRGQTSYPRPAVLAPAPASPRMVAPLPPPETGE